ncbi:Glycosyltransferase [Heracleum sosnowskyi]|uniref:Glycosyltransferase n=1 Tax=Heracleum sosnowskyi TaxID=360622 RepID=A0AAD8J167_9APIA|nr:Glycosyltransferase [Heracleum sosnowskyi]
MGSVVKPEQLHFILIPLFCQSASTPITELGLLLAKRGVNVTIITTGYNVVLYKSSIEIANTTWNLNIRLLSLDPPGQGKNNTMRQQALEKLMQELVPPPSCMVSSETWGTGYTHLIAWKFKIPSYIFYPRSCFSMTCANYISGNKLLDGINPYTDSFLVEGIPHKVELKGYQSPFFQRASKVGENQIRGGMQDVPVNSYPSRGLLVNNFEEMEPLYFGQFKKQYSNAWGIGPVSLCHKEISDKIDRGQKASIDANHCLNWLNSMKPDSVIYACFGSLSCILPSQLVEIGLGLESSNQPFIWVIRTTSYSAEIGRWLETNKFEKRVEGEMKRRARELGGLANKAVEEGGSSHSNITKFIEDVMQIVKEEQVKQMPKKVKCQSSRYLTNATAFEILVKPFHMLRHCYGVDISVKFKNVFQAWNKSDYITAYVETRCWKLQIRKRPNRKRTTIHNGWLQFRDDLQLAVDDLCMFEWKNDTVRNFNVRIVKKVPAAN